MPAYKMKRKKNSSSRKQAPAPKPGQKRPNVDIYHNFHFSESNFEDNESLLRRSVDFLRVVELYFLYRFESIPKGKEFAEKKLFSDKVLLENFNLKKELSNFNRIKYGNFRGSPDQTRRTRCRTTSSFSRSTSRFG